MKHQAPKKLPLYDFKRLLNIKPNYIFARH
ncbi:hypothetical protein GGR71_000535 [Xanthomonas sp. F1]